MAAGDRKIWLERAEINQFDKGEVSLASSLNLKNWMKGLLALLMVVGFFAIPSSSFAAGHSLKKTNDESYIQKVTPYIVQKHNQFKLTHVKKVKGLLTQEQYKQVRQSIAKSNHVLKEASKTQDITLGESKSYTFTIQLQQPDQATGMIHPNISYFSGNVRIHLRWWGVQAHFSHHAVQVFKHNIALYGVGYAGIKGAVEILLGTTSPPGWAWTLIGGIYALGGWYFVHQDHGCGVNLNVYWWGSVRIRNAC